MHMWQNRIAGLELNPGLLNAEMLCFMLFSLTESYVESLRYASLTYRVICRDKFNKC